MSYNCDLNGCGKSDLHNYLLLTTGNENQTVCFQNKGIFCWGVRRAEFEDNDETIKQSHYIAFYDWSMLVFWAKYLEENQIANSTIKPVNFWSC